MSLGAAAIDDDDTNIWIAASDGKLETVKALLSAGVAVNAQDFAGYSAV